MKTLVRDGPMSVREAEVIAPRAVAEEVLLRVGASGLSRSDLQPRDIGAFGGGGAGVQLGQNVAGTILDGAHKGVRVVVNPQGTCGQCDACLCGRSNLCPNQFNVLDQAGGGLAECIAVDPRHTFKIPNVMSFEEACLIPIYTKAWHIARMARRVFPRGRAALVLGRGAAATGARLALLAQGVDDVTAWGSTGGRGVEHAARNRFDLILDIESSETSRALAADHIAPGGVIGVTGPVSGEGGYDLAHLAARDVTAVCANGYSALDFTNAAAAAMDGRLGALDWPQVFALEDGPQVVKDLHAGRVDRDFAVFSFSEPD